MCSILLTVMSLTQSPSTESSSSHLESSGEPYDQPYKISAKLPRRSLSSGSHCNPIHRLDTQTAGSGSSNFYQSIQKRKCKHISEVISAKCLDCCIVPYSHTKQIFTGLRVGDTEIKFGEECFHKNPFCCFTSVSSYC